MNRTLASLLPGIPILLMILLLPYAFYDPVLVRRSTPVRKVISAHKHLLQAHRYERALFYVYDGHYLIDRAEIVLLLITQCNNTRLNKNFIISDGHMKLLLPKGRMVCMFFVEFLLTQYTKSNDMQKL